MKSSLTAALVACSILIAGLAIAGNTTPPAGPVAGTMKTLDEVRPGVPIHASDLPMTISQPGFYYLAESITTAGAGITINSSDVTIDLMGHLLQGGSGAGISGTTSGFQNVTVRNGAVAGWSSAGIRLSGIEGAVVENVMVRNVLSQGIWVGVGGRISSCSAIACVQNGSPSTYAIAASEGGIIEDCITRESLGGGLWVGTGGIIRDSTSDGNGSSGVRLGTRSILQDSLVTDNADHGVLVSGPNVRVVGNLIDNHDIAISSTGAGLHIEDNYISTCTTHAVESLVVDTIVIRNTFRNVPFQTVNLNGNSGFVGAMVSAPAGGVTNWDNIIQ